MGTALARPIEDIQKELHDLIAIAGDQPTREQRAAQCARMSELHDALNAKALADGSLFVPNTAARRLGQKGMSPHHKNGRRTAREWVTDVFGLTLPQQRHMMDEARNPGMQKRCSLRSREKKTNVTSVASLLRAITKVWLRSTEEEQQSIIDHVLNLARKENAA